MRNKYVISIHILCVVAWIIGSWMHVRGVQNGLIDIIGGGGFALAIISWFWVVANMYMTGNRPRRSPARQRLDI